MRQKGACTLAVVLPSLMNDQGDRKREKSLQYAANVWNICDGSEDARIDALFGSTRRFSEQMGIKTQLSDYVIGAPEIDYIVNALKEHGMTTLGEHDAIIPEDARRILNAAL